jgi:hypothetical protein
MPINREWHALHKLGQKTKLEERLNWHLEHAANCGCREMPPSIRRELEARGLLVPTAPGLNWGRD